MVSIIVPLFNKAAFVRRALASALEQTFADFEIIVVDDGSTDDGGEIVASISDPRIRIVRQDNAGPGAARNRGIAEARCAYLAFLDADDAWHPRYLERSLELLHRYPEAAAVSSGFIFQPSGLPASTLWRRRGLHDGLWKFETAMRPQLAVDLLASMWPTTTLARAAAVRAFGGFCARKSARYGEDAALFLKLLLNERVIVNLESLADYHTDASSLSTHRRGPRPVEAFLDDTDELYAKCPPELAPLLGDVLAATALKTACMLAYWGRWREGQLLIRRFCRKTAWKQPWFVPARLGVNPVGSLTARAWRTLR